MWRLSPRFAASRRGVRACASAFRRRLMSGGGAGGAWLGEVFKPGLALPGGVAGASGVVSHRCRFVAGLPMRAGPSPVLPLCRARPLADVGSGSRVCAWGLLCTVLVGCGGERRMTDETLPSAFAKIQSTSSAVEPTAFSKRSELFNSHVCVYLNGGLNMPCRFGSSFYARSPIAEGRSPTHPRSKTWRRGTSNTDETLPSAFAKILPTSSAVEPTASSKRSELFDSRICVYLNGGLNMPCRFGSSFSARSEQGPAVD